MQLPRRHIAIKNINPDTISIHGENDVRDIDNVVIEIDEDLIQQELVKLQAAYDVFKYARNRKTDYPSNGDQWDMIYKDNKNSTTTHADAVEAVKTKWPKDNSGPVE